MGGPRRIVFFRVEMNEERLGEESILSLVWMTSMTRGSEILPIERGNRGGEEVRYHGSTLDLRALGASLCLVSVARVSA